MENHRTDLQEIREKAIREFWGKVAVTTLADILNLHRTTVTKKARALGLPIREPKLPKHIKLTPKSQELLDGLLLGGNALCLNRESAFFVATSEERDYILWIAQQLEQCGIKKEGRGIYQKRGSYVLVTRSYYELRSMYERWYPQGTKEVPKDLKLTPQVLLLWFIRGGHIEITNRKPRRAIRFWVWRYSPQSRQHLIKKLQEIGLRPSLYVGERMAMIRVGPGDLYTFFNYIGPCPPELQETFGHKWTLPR